MINVIYICSRGHSGSTLLDLLLGSHSKIFSMGEIHYLYNYINLEPLFKKGRYLCLHECACGDSVWQCTFWNKVHKNLSAKGLSLACLDIESENMDVFCEDNYNLLAAISEVSGSCTIVDSSKNINRMVNLMEIEQINVIPINLVRGSKGNINSILRKYPENSLLSEAIKYNIHFFKLYFDLLKLRLTPNNIININYEQLVRNPETELKLLMSKIGLDFEKAQLRWADSEKHNIDGNKNVLDSTDSRLSLDNRWMNDLSFFQCRYIDLLTIPAKILNKL